jgi:hypothetical protein
MTSTSAPETVTSIVAKTFDPAKAASKMFAQEGPLYSLWRLAVYLLKYLFAAKEHKSSICVDDDYEQADLDTVAARGKFPARPSDLFLKVHTLSVGRAEL